MGRLRGYRAAFGVLALRTRPESKFLAKPDIPRHRRADEHDRAQREQDARKEYEHLEMPLVRDLEERACGRRPGESRDRDEDVYRAWIYDIQVRGSMREGKGEEIGIGDAPRRAPYTSRGVMDAMYVARRERSAPAFRSISSSQFLTNESLKRMPRRTGEQAVQGGESDYGASIVRGHPKPEDEDCADGSGGYEALQTISNGVSTDLK